MKPMIGSDHCGVHTLLCEVITVLRVVGDGWVDEDCKALTSHPLDHLFDTLKLPWQSVIGCER